MTREYEYMVADNQWKPNNIYSRILILLHILHVYPILYKSSLYLSIAFLRGMNSWEQSRMGNSYGWEPHSCTTSWVMPIAEDLGPSPELHLSL